jgi:hypothetical protein
VGESILQETPTNCENNYYNVINEENKDLRLNYINISYIILFHPVSNCDTYRHQFESGKTQKTAGRRLGVAIGKTKVTIAITIIHV